MENIEQLSSSLNGAQFEDDDGSMLGKFKDATSLLNAYNNLQAEFTRKSQKLAELTKKNADELSEKDDALTGSTKDTKENNSLDKDVKEDIATANLSENSSCTKNEDKPDIDDFDAVLSKKLLKFAENQPQVINVVEAVKSEILQNKDLLNLQNGIDIAYRLVREKQKSEPAEIIKDPNFLQQYILSNSDITSQIVDEYIRSLATKNASPKLISGDSKTMVVSPTENSPKSLSDANKIFAKMLEK